VTIRELTPGEVEFEVECHPEEIPIRGNCSAVDDMTDRKTEKWIYDQLRRGNQWAWCMVRVVARWKEYEADDTLGACSYRSEKQFREPGGYFDDMKHEALANLNAELAQHAEALEELRI
jgi:hypothetical protein